MEVVTVATNITQMHMLSECVCVCTLHVRIIKEMVAILF